MDNIFGIGINVTFSGIVIVFAMLILLVLILTLFGKVGQLFKKKETKTPAVTNKPVPAVVYTKKPKPTEPSAEVIAVIAAAVASMYNDTKIKPVIRSIRRTGARPAWSAAGIADNTRPF